MRKFFYAHIPMRGYTDIWEYSELRRGNIWEYSERNNTTTSTTFTPSDPSPMPPVCGQVRGRTSGERPGRKVPVQWYKKFRVRERTRRAWAENAAETWRNFSGKVQAVQVQGGGYRICIYAIDI